MDIISRAEARSAGLKRYFTGRPCKYGHVAERHAAGAHCVECERLWVENNRDFVRRRNSKWNKKNRPAMRAAVKRWALKDPEKAKRIKAASKKRNAPKIVVYMARYVRDNPDKYRAYNSRRRARTRQGYSDADVQKLKALQRGKCALCFLRFGKRYHVDHILPLARGGSNERTNIQLTCQRCNLSKSARDPIEHAAKLGRLV